VAPGLNLARSIAGTSIRIDGDVDVIGVRSAEEIGAPQIFIITGVEIKRNFNPPRDPLELIAGSPGEGGHVSGNFIHRDADW
jgi:hypothetical protein